MPPLLPERVTLLLYPARNPRPQQRLCWLRAEPWQPGGDAPWAIWLSRPPQQEVQNVASADVRTRVAEMGDEIQVGPDVLQGIGQDGQVDWVEVPAGQLATLISDLCQAADDAAAPAEPGGVQDRGWAERVATDAAESGRLGPERRVTQVTGVLCGFTGIADELGDLL